MLFQFNDCSIDPDRRELRRGAELIEIGPQVFDLILFLIRNRDRVVSKNDMLDAVWAGRVVSESTLASRINAARSAIGDSGAEQTLIKTVSRKGVRFVGEVRERSRTAPIEQAESVRPTQAAALRQEIQFCKAADGACIAYAAIGSGPPLLKTANWLNHLEYDWQSPIWSHLLRDLAAKYSLIRYDGRGNGLSDWDVDDISFEAFVRDLECVADTNGLQKFPLLGISQGCAVSICYAVRHPERVSHLVLYGGYARGRRLRGQAEAEKADALLTLMRLGWGQENPAFRQIFTSMFIPGATAEQAQWFNDLQRITTSSENAVRLRRAQDEIDIVSLLPEVRVPTLVLHCRDDAVVPFEEGRRMAAGIAGAQFVALEGRNHLILEHEPAWPRFLDEVTRFLNAEPA